MNLSLINMNVNIQIQIGVVDEKFLVLKVSRTQESKLNKEYLTWYLNSEKENKTSFIRWVKRYRTGLIPVKLKTNND